LEYAVIVGSLGTALLLIAFFLNLFKFLRTDSIAYAVLNVFGGALSSYASYLINFMPFVILEGTWALVALVKLVKLLSKPKAAR
jgi:hypothetical protein